MLSNHLGTGMRTLFGWTGALLLLALPSSAQTTYTTASPAAAIPDNSGGVFTACQTITVPAATGLITDVDVRVATSHSWVGDLTYRLVSPAPSTLMVMNRPGRIGSGVGNSANFAAATPITFNDTAASGRSAEDIGEDPVNTACATAAIVGSTCGPDNYIPAPDATDTPIAGLGTNLAQFNGVDPAGVWTLCAADSAVADTGTLTSWSLIVTTVAGGCTLTCPSDVTVSSSANQCGAVVNYPAPTTSGSCGPIVCAPPSGSFFPVGTTAILCQEDILGFGEGEPGGESCTLNVTVIDTQPPSITAPANQNVGTDAGVCNAVVNYPAPSASDNCPGVTASCAPPSGSTFALGATPATCTALDAAGNTATAGFSVTVFDDEPPTLVCPADVFATAPPGSLSWPVSYASPTPTDNCPGATAGCTPPSGSAFPVGTTTAVCTAIDGAGLSTVCDFDVTVEERVIQEIPTASTLGLALLALLIAGAAFVALRRVGG